MKAYAVSGRLNQLPTQRPVLYGECSADSVAHLGL